MTDDGGAPIVVLISSNFIFKDFCQLFITHLNVDTSSETYKTNVKSSNSPKIEFQPIFYFSINDLLKCSSEAKWHTRASLLPHVLSSGDTRHRVTRDSSLENLQAAQHYIIMLYMHILAVKRKIKNTHTHP